MKHQMHKREKAQDVWFDASTFAASIRAKRGQRSLRETASEIGAVSPSTLARLECSTIPGIETFLRLCDWLQQPTSAFIRLSTVVPGIHTPEGNIQRIEQELRADGVLSPQAVDAFITIIRAVVINCSATPTHRCHNLGAPDPVTGQPIRLTDHHLGAPYATGKRGNPHDKHDLRRENLQALCPACHAEADRPLYERWQRRMQRRAAGTHALVPYGYDLDPWQGGRA